MEKQHGGNKIYANLCAQGIELSQSCFRTKNSGSVFHTTQIMFRRAHAYVQKEKYISALNPTKNHSLVILLKLEPQLSRVQL